ncbi:hypothetical protein EHS25_006874 [Saitozyma podzolica]|uniref:BZIP domain-containing protein n=1 Tax=Saitozyma podzolica TaxID=1890683 RepID=A0A427XRR4_9TREE|nr:hypothetical protein EHS25_006874 [Saitozyma podzolica]
MDDYTNILSSDFPARSASPPAADQHQHLQQQHASHAGPSGTGNAAVDGGAALDADNHAMDFSFDSAQGDESFGPPQAEAAQSLGTPGPRLTDEEKKARVRSSNRKAAEKSRNKKRREQNVLEDAVNATREENERLRQRIAALSAARNGGAQVDTANAQEASPAVSPPQETPGIDFTYLGKLQAEISSAKTQLLDKQLELNRLKAGDAAAVPYAEIEVLRHVLLSHHGKLATLQAEASSLQAVIEHVQRERTELAAQRESLAKEVEARKGASGVTGLEAGVDTTEEATSGLPDSTNGHVDSPSFVDQEPAV